jgi:hypothetical protein
VWFWGHGCVPLDTKAGCKAHGYSANCSCNSHLIKKAFAFAFSRVSVIKLTTAKQNRWQLDSFDLTVGLIWPLVSEQRARRRLIRRILRRTVRRMTRRIRQPRISREHFRVWTPLHPCRHVVENGRVSVQPLHGLGVHTNPIVVYKRRKRP